MSLASPQNRKEFKQYIKTKLGAPVLEINVADEQMDLCVNDAFQYFHERNHFNGIERGYLTFEMNDELRKALTEQEEIVVDSNGVEHKYRKQNNYLVLPDNVVGVVQVMSSRSSFMTGGIVPGGMLFPLLMGGIMGTECNYNFSLSSYYAMQEFLALLDWMFHPPKAFNFNQRTHRLTVQSNFRGFGSGRLVCIEVMLKPDPDLFPDVYNDLWLKEYATALVKQQWGRNLTKYAQVQLPGGIVMNGDRILQEANQEVATIRERFAMDWADPVLDMVG